MTRMICIYEDFMDDVHQQMFMTPMMFMMILLMMFNEQMELSGNPETPAPVSSTLLLVTSQ